MIGRNICMSNFFKKHYKKIIALLVCVIIAGTFPAKSYALTYDDITSDAIKDKENQITAAEEQKKKLEESLAGLAEEKKELEGIKGDLEAFIKELDSELAQLENEVENLNQLIAAKESEILDAELELAQALLTEQEQYEAMKLRIQFMYEQGEGSYFALLLSADDFADMLNKADYIEQLSAYDRQKLEEYEAITKYVELCKKGLEAEKALLDTAKAKKLVAQVQTEALIANKESEVDKYEKDIANKEALIAQYEEDLAYENEVISQLEEEVLAAKKEILTESGIVITYNGEKMTWPCPSYTRISSPFGWRIHPTLGVNKFHNGVDMASAKGTDILAAFSGEVVAATYNSTMGNYVLMNHGNGYYTIYMHASKLCVTPGEIVVQGEKIAEVGSTGRSTGPHLHFGVRKDGEYVDPMLYLNK